MPHTNPPYSISSLMSMWTPRCWHNISCTCNPLLFLAHTLGLFTPLYMASTEQTLLSHSNFVFNPQVSALPFSPIGSAASRAHNANVQVRKEYISTLKSNNAIVARSVLDFKQRAQLPDKICCSICFPGSTTWN